LLACMHEVWDARGERKKLGGSGTIFLYVGLIVAEPTIFELGSKF
jgi:hypothetical protein